MNAACGLARVRGNRGWLALQETAGRVPNPTESVKNC